MLYKEGLNNSSRKMLLEEIVLGLLSPTYIHVQVIGIQVTILWLIILLLV